MGPRHTHNKKSADIFVNKFEKRKNNNVGKFNFKMALYKKTKFYVGSCGEPIICELFNEDFPLIGLEYLVEIIQGPNADRTYECLLCQTTLESKDVISCVVSARHRLKYLVSQTSVSCKNS